MDPYVSRLVSPVTEYSARPGSSSSSNSHSSSKGTNRILCALKQGPRSLENHIREFLVFTHYSDLPDIILIEIFCNGINQPLQSQLRREGPRSSLSCFLDYALLCTGSSFTVGVTEEESSTASTSEMVTRQNAFTKWRLQQHPVTSVLPVKGQVKSPLMLKSQVKSPLMLKSQVKSTLMLRSQGKSQLRLKSQIKSQLMLKSQVKSQLILKAKSNHSQC